MILIHGTSTGWEGGVRGLNSFMLQAVKKHRVCPNVILLHIFSVIHKIVTLPLFHSCTFVG